MNYHDILLKEAIPRAHGYVVFSSFQLEPSGSGTDGVSHLCEGQQEPRQSLVAQRTGLAYPGEQVTYPGFQNSS